MNSNFRWNLATAVTLLAPSITAQAVPRVPQIADVRPLPYVSPAVDNTSGTAAMVFEKTIRFAGASMLQLELAAWKLPNRGWLEITSLRDRATERLDAAILSAHEGMTAYFNGDALRVRLWAGPHTRRSQFRIATVAVGKPASQLPATLCGPDTRVPSTDKRVARILLRTSTGVGFCTAWLISRVNCFATAGHCIGTSGIQSTTAQFNVPQSTSSGNLVNPAPSEQYVWETASNSRALENAGLGKDWGVFRTQRNSVTNLHAGKKQGSWFEITGTPSAQSNTRITGHGTDATPTPRRNGTQQTATGPLLGRIGNRLQYRTDTTGGNSGSPVIDVATNKAFGVHSHGGCSPSVPGSSNSGTAADHTGFAAARQRLCVFQGSYTTYGAGCSGSGGKQGQVVLPKAYATKMGQAASIFPHSRRNMRYQQVFLGSEIGGAKTFADLCLRLDDALGGPAGVQTLTVKLGPTAKDPTTLTTDFAANYSGTATTVFSGNLNLPAHTGGGGVNDFKVCFKFPKFYAYTGGNLIVEMINTSTTAASHFEDMAQGAADVTTAQCYAFSATATKATAVIRQRGLVMCLKERGTAAPKLAASGVPMIGKSFQVTLADARPNAPALLSLGSRVAVPLPPSVAPGCTLYSTLDVLGAVVTDANGAAAITFPLPNLRDLICVKFADQYLVLDIVNPLGIVFSNGGEAEIGG